MVAIRDFGSHEAAQIAASNLEARGIDCSVRADDCGGMYPNLTLPGKVRLFVRDSDAGAANALLGAEASAAEIHQMETAAASAQDQEPVPPAKLAWGQIIAGVIAGVLFCLIFQSPSDSGIKTYYHYARNGKVDREWEYLDGHLQKFFQDRNGDGKWDQWSYYERGIITRSEYDNNFDGKPDDTWTFSNDLPTSLEKDTDFNGIADEFCTYNYGVLQQVDIKPNASPFTTVREFFQHGVLKEIWRGGDSNGSFKEVVHYDPFFNPIITNQAAQFFLLPAPPK